MRNLLLTLTAAAAFSAAPAYAEDIIYDGIVYTVTEGTEVEAKGFAEGKTENLVIPATFNADGTDYTVVAIADEAFRTANLRSAILPETLRSIGNSAFAFNMFMKECNLPESLESVGDNAFQRCWSAIMTPRGIARIGAGAFWECSKMTEVTIPENAEVGDNAFMYCTGVKTLVLEGMPQSVGSCAFSFNSLQELTVKSTTPPAFVPEDAFCYGDNETRDFKWTLDLATVALKVPAGAKDTYQTDRNWSIFTNVTELQPDVITDFTVAPFDYKVTADGEVTVKAFDGSATSLVIPSTVEYAGQSFNVTAISDNVFANSAVTEATVPGSVKTIGENAFINCASLTALTLEEGTGSIGKCAFSGTALTALTLPKGTEEVGYGAFMGCRSLATLTLPEGIKVDDLAFFNCVLEKVVLEGAPEKISNNSMASLQLREVVFHTQVVPDMSPANVWLISENQFNDKVVLIVDNEEMAKAFMAVPAWDVFKAILPTGTGYDEHAPYLPQNEISTIEAVNESTGLKAFVPAGNSVRMLTTFDFSFILWDGRHGIRIDDYTERISFSAWWDVLAKGDYVNGYIIGMMNPETGIFTSTSHSVKSEPCQEEMKPVEVTGKQLTDTEDDSFQYAYVTMFGSVSNTGFVSQDGHRFSLKNSYNEYLESVVPCATAIVRGIYMREETAAGNNDVLIVMDSENFYTNGIDDIMADGDDSTIYSVAGTILGTDADTLAPGLYIRGNKKFIKR